MARVQRFDQGGLEKPVELPNGWLRVDAYLTRTGVFEYVDEKGNSRFEYRPESTVFDEASLKSFEAVPLTNDHPPETLDANNTSKYQVGHLVGAPVRDGDKMRAQILVTDAKTIADMKGGKREISNGYFCECDEKPGVTPDGQRYDAIQRDVVGNHTALVDAGRAGPAVRARVDAAASSSRFDGASARMVVSDSQEIGRTAARGQTQMIKFKVDGVEVEISEAAAQLVEKERAQASAKADAAAKELKDAKDAASAAQAKADATAKELAETKAKLDAAPSAIKAELKARAKLEDLAAKVCGAETKVDGVSDKDLRKAIAATMSDEKLDEKEDAYIAVLVDMASKKAAEKADVAEVMANTSPVEDPDKNKQKKTVEQVAAEAFKNAGKR